MTEIEKQILERLPEVGEHFTWYGDVNFTCCYKGCERFDVDINYLTFKAVYRDNLGVLHKWEFGQEEMAAIAASR